VSQVNASPFGKLSPTQFLKRHWQKKPLMVRGAFKDFTPTLEPFRPADVLALARRDDAESRLVENRRGKWSLRHGPFSPTELRALGPRNWTVLVQDTQHFSPAAEALLARFAFLPNVRVDDLMVSLAAAGGGVGAHVDSYDVFLIQGRGRRRWRISGQKDRTFKPDLPLKILQHFEPEEEWVLETGDMLYLPPGYAHEGVALDECLTYSVGFRAPTNQEWIESFLDQVRDSVDVPGQYADPGLRATSRPGEIPADILHAMHDALLKARWSRADVDVAAGRFLTEPKGHVVFDPPQSELDAPNFREACLRHGVRLDGRTRMAYRGETLFINGESANVPSARKDADLLRTLADSRRLPPPCKPGKSALELLHDWYEGGFLHVDN
jgi:50S ribosomal protein L16 3-hydroxylase